MLWGRAAEVAALGELVAGARAGRSGAICVRGEPGIGKTSLLEEAAAGAAGCRLLRAVGVGAESQLAFAGLYGLVRPLLDRADELPASVAGALRGALGLGPPTGAERFAVGAATLGLLSLAAEREPIVCLIDDLHWLDAGSRDALLFAARRLGPEGIAVIVSMRDPEGRQLDTAGIPDLPLAGLDATAAEELLRARGMALAPSAVAELTTRCAGNPLALAEVAGRLSERQRAGREPLGEILPVGPEVERSYRARLEGLAERERLALLVLALQEDEGPAALVAALSRLGLAASDLDSAEATGLVAREAGRAWIAHPLARAAIVQAADAADVRRAHGALGEAQDDPERRAWHLALGADGPDAPAADALEAVGGLAVARGDPLTASRAFALAAGLSPERGPRARRYLSAGQMAAVAGVPPFELLDRARAEAPDPAVADEALVMQAAVLAWSGQTAPLQALLDAELPGIEQRSGEQAAIIHGLAVNVALSTGDLDALRRHGRAAATLWGDRPLTGDPRSLEMVTQTGAASAHLADGDTDAALRLLRPCVELLERGGGSIDIAAPLGGFLVMIGAYPLARRAFDSALGRARAGGQLVSLAWTLVLGTLLGWAEGRLRETSAAGAEGAELGRLCRNPYAAGASLATRSLVAAARGDADEVARCGAEGLPMIDEAGAPWVAAVFRHSAALIALNAGDLEAARAELEGALPARVTRAFQPVPLDHDLVEVLARLGDVEAARAIGADVATHGAGSARAERCRALVADDDEQALEHFEAALAQHALMPAALEQARTHLLYGERLRRMGRRSQGRGQLELALAGLERIGATGFGERARAELRAAGARPARRDPSAPETLTGQERQIAAEVALGRSNREVAAALFISPKTVEMHLTRVYRKLGLRSRAQLVRLAADGGLGEGIGAEAPRT